MNLDNFFDGEEPELDAVMFFDMSQIALAAAFQESPDTPIDEGMLRHIILNSIKFNIKKFKSEYPIIILAFDNANNGYWRRDYGYFYKKNRGEARKESVFDFAGFFEALNKIKEEFKTNMPYYVIDIARVEADDSIGVLTKRFSLEGRRTLIISSDGDYGQLHKYKNVKQWSPMHKKYVSPKTSPEELLMTKLLKGDRKDNVAGVRCRSDFWHTRIEGERSPSISSKLIEACLNDGQEKHLSESELTRFKENQIMIDMEYIPTEIQQSIIDQYDNYKLPGRNKIYPYFVKTKLVRLLTEINMF